MNLSPLIVNRDQVLARIGAACAACGRSPSEVTLVWVSKTRPIEDVEEAVAAGAIDFGENRVQEALDKFSKVRPGIRCHIIGPVQSNKLRKAVTVAQSIDSVSSLDMVGRLQQLAQEEDRQIGVLFQVNTSGEDTKSGLSMQNAASFLESLPQCSHLLYQGLMTIGKNTGNPEDSRAGFAWLRHLRDRFAGRDSRFSRFTELSMGMTDDLEVAIAEGATQVRIGTALFGHR